MTDLETAARETIATLWALRHRLEINDLGGEEEPYLQDCDTAIALLESALSTTET